MPLASARSKRPIVATPNGSSPATASASLEFGSRALPSLPGRRQTCDSLGGPASSDGRRAAANGEGSPRRWPWPDRRTIRPDDRRQIGRSGEDLSESHADPAGCREELWTDHTARNSERRRQGHHPPAPAKPRARRATPAGAPPPMTLRTCYELRWRSNGRATHAASRPGHFQWRAALSQTAPLRCYS